MFAFDPAALPHVSTRKALLVIDAQNDFLSSTEGALPVRDAEELMVQIAELVADFRGAGGDVVWVRTEYDTEVRDPIGKILDSDLPPTPQTRASSARRSRRPLPPSLVRRTSSGDGDGPDGESSPPSSDPDAFLSPLRQEVRPCVRATTPGAELPASLKPLVHKRDLVFVKKHYSAFDPSSGQLLKTLRARMVTELFLCGSLVNVGVYATAMDAARHGYALTVVEDCCGSRAEPRHGNAVGGLVEYTGCNVLGRTEVARKSGKGDGTAEKSPTPTDSSSISGKAKVKMEEDETPRARRDPTMSPGLSTPMDELKLEENASPRLVPAQPHDRPSAEARPFATPAGSDDSPQRTSVPAMEKAGMSQKPELDLNTQLESPSLRVEGKYKHSRAASSSSSTSSSSSSSTRRSSKMAKPNPSAKVLPPICEGDTTIIHNVLPAALLEGLFDRLREEVDWQRMMHQGGEVPRLVAVQGTVASDGTQPIYRHPADESPPLRPFTPAVAEIKAEVERHLGHELNHVLIQMYRSGNDYISEHSDKTLDISKGSFIANVSLGAERTMVFRTKRVDKDPSQISESASPTTGVDTPSKEEQQPEAVTSPLSKSDAAAAEGSKRRIERAALPHNSLCRMGLATNMRWLHAIRQDKRLEREKSPQELAFAGARISLTFRRIGTFLDAGGAHIWGQGATSKTREGARPVINGQTDEAVRMIRAFGVENHSSDFDWDKFYGEGFDVLHVNAAARLFASADGVVNGRVTMMLAHLGIQYAKGTMGVGAPDGDGLGAGSETQAIKFVDNDPDRTAVLGDFAVMLYLDAMYGSGSSEEKSKKASRVDLARNLSCFQRGLALLERWRAVGREVEEGQGQEQEQEQGQDIRKKRNIALLKRELAVWDSYASKTPFLAGDGMGLADFAVWPVLHDIVRVEKGSRGVLDGFTGLKRYYDAVAATEAAVKVVGSPAP